MQTEKVKYRTPIPDRPTVANILECATEYGKALAQLMQPGTAPEIIATAQEQLTAAKERLQSLCERTGVK